MIPYRVAFGNARPGREVLGPSTGAERIEVADALRGFAVCGILLANILYFMPIGNVDGPALDRLAEAGVLVFAQGKFFTIFSLLFGWGIAVQLGRAERQGWTDRFPRLLVRRLLVLGVIGAAHFALLSVAQVPVEEPYVRHDTKRFDLLTEAHGLGLMLYAVTGLVLVCVRGARPAVLVRWAIGIVAVTAAISALLLGSLELARAYGDAELAQGDGYRREGLIRYGGSSFLLVMAPRVAFYVVDGWVMLAVPTVLAMFMAGFAAGRWGMLRRLAEHRSSVRRVCAWGLAVGLPLAALAFAGICLSGLSAWMAIWFNRGGGGPVMAIGYCAGIALLWQRPAWRRWLHPLTWFGRMALTNYLLQSAIAAALFLGYRLALAAWMVSPAQAWLIAAAILAAQLAAQMAASRWWLRRYRFGPAEWLWRTLTYGQAPPMRIAATPPPIER